MYSTVILKVNWNNKVICLKPKCFAMLQCLCVSHVITYESQYFNCVNELYK